MVSRRAVYGTPAFHRDLYSSHDFSRANSKWFVSLESSLLRVAAQNTAFVIGVMEFGSGWADTAAYQQKEFSSFVSCTVECEFCASALDKNQGQGDQHFEFSPVEHFNYGWCRG